MTAGEMTARETPSDLLAAIAAVRPDLSPKLERLAAFALATPERFIRKTSREICAELGTSEPTLIKFCQRFGYTGVSAFRIDLALALAHPGRGAGPGSGLVEPLARDRRQVNMAAKQAIARRAVGLIGDDRGLLIDNGSTAEIFAATLGALPPLTIMTTGLRVAQNALTHGQHSVMLTGGRIRPDALSLEGRLVEASIGTMRFDTFVMGADAVDPEQGLSTFLEDEAHNTKVMLGAARRVIVLADRTKISKPSLHRICDMGQVHILVTDLDPADAVVAAIGAQGVEVLCIDMTGGVADAVA